jgi:hypothetical protein
VIRLVTRRKSHAADIREREPRRLSAILLSTLALLPFLAGCSSSPKPSDPPAMSAEIDSKKLCNDQGWKEQHLGLWFDVCQHNTM